MKVKESFNDNHLIEIQISKKEIKAISDKKSKYFGGCINIEPPKSDGLQILISMEDE